MSKPLPSWRPGATRDSILAFLDDLDHVPVDERVAYLDNDGTMWCEKPSYVQFDFFLDALQQRVEDDPSLRERAEFAAVLDGDMAAIGELGLARVAGALAALFDKQTPSEFDTSVDDFLDRYRHPTLGVSLNGVIYQPMLELLDELRAREFTIGIVTGGGTEFVRRVSKRCYAVEPGMVVGTLIGYTFDRDEGGKPVVRRTISEIGSANEGGAKVEHIQSQIGRPPILVDHDDDQREFAYQSTAATFQDDEPITTIGERLGWVIVSMQHDWQTIFAPA